ncbi:sterol desaturase family protein [Paracoccus sp. PARArs4]|uniref:sterol desaturase family protein n=1 Tax=Paracoccus sp. PARArs4 TaxID=2853442 RepID=UPI0024A74068|nr:sterol desaturase family protein [Paracoccus sp. PARArs4]
MSTWAAILTVILTVAAMELTAYSVHRWIMHGPLGWGWHKSHHDEDHDHALEKNDLYGVVFAVISIVLFAIGAMGSDLAWWLAVGVTCYGLIYYFLHDGLVHGRWPFRYVPKRGYLRRVYQAHRMHHAVHGRENCVSFGFIWAPSVDSLKAELKRSGALLKDREGADRNA